MNKKNDGWTELSNALSFGGSTARPQKRKVVKTTKKESDAMWRQMKASEIKELLRCDSDENNERFHAIKESLRAKGLTGNALSQEAMIVLCDEKEVSE